MKQMNWQRLFMAGVLACGGAVAGAHLSSPSTARAEVQETVSQPNFQPSTVPILKDISVTLRQMDARLARLEIVAQKMQAAKSGRSVATSNIDAAK
jgi:hypothetical protein